MNRRIETRVVEVPAAETNTIIDRDASEVYWITVSEHTLDTQFLIQIYDGYDTAGRLKWHCDAFRANHFNFIPPIHCEMGVFVYTNEHVQSYTIAWRPKKWDRPKPMKADEIKHPEA